MGEKTRVLIYGSCVSRDTFEFLMDDFELLGYIARQSFISANNPAVGLSEKIEPLKSSFQDRMVRGDIRGNAFDLISKNASRTDILLMDLIDERGGVIKTHGGAVSKLSEFWSSTGREAVIGDPLLAIGDDKHFAQWKRSVDELKALLVKENLFHRVLVLEAPWATVYEDGTSYTAPSWMLDPLLANKFYRRYYDYLVTSGFALIQLPQELVVTTEGHKWGASPFHYSEKAYLWFAKEIKNFWEVCSGKGQLKESFDAEVPERPIASRRMLERWGSFQTVDNLSEARIQKGKLEPISVRAGENFVDILVEDNGAETTLVTFHAALGSGHSEIPVFTGRSISDSIGVNRLFISDASLNRSENLPLAWFLGDRELDLTTEIEDIVASFQALSGAEHLVFFGMSGGGFASLNIAQLFPGSLAIPVNPQTSVLGYAKEHWFNFASQCLGASNEDEGAQLIDNITRSDLGRVYRTGFENHVLYVQNRKDAHLKIHMKPWLDELLWDSRVYALTGDWGAGHVPPPANELRRILSSIARVEGDWPEYAIQLGAVNNLKPELL